MKKEFSEAENIVKVLFRAGLERRPKAELSQKNRRMSSAHLAVADSPLFARLHPAAVQQYDQRPVAGRRAGRKRKKGRNKIYFFRYVHIVIALFRNGRRSQIFCTAMFWVACLWISKINVRFAVRMASISATSSSCSTLRLSIFKTPALFQSFEFTHIKPIVDPSVKR